MKVATWNVNGIRSAYRKGLLQWIQKEQPDILCLQEIKANSDSLDTEIREIEGYYSYFNSALKKGYSGTAMYTKIKPVSVIKKIGIKRFDDEGRSIKLVFKDFVLFNFYIPHGGRKKENLIYKLEVYKKIFSILKRSAGKNVIVCGDFNIAHTELDLYYPKRNTNNIMFTVEERKQIDFLQGLGFIDTFRHINKDTKTYTWWPYAFNARNRDIGWRIDYIFVSQKYKNSIIDSWVRKEVIASDHAAFVVNINKK